MQLMSILESTLFYTKGIVKWKSLLPLIEVDGVEGGIRIYELGRKQLKRRFLARLG